jgi:riboflavin biosynthesis pyrimidine reductase
MKVPLRDDGSFVLPDLFRVLTTPAPEFCGITSLLVEGGAVTWDAFTSTGAVDAMVTLVGA